MIPKLYLSVHLPTYLPTYPLNTLFWNKESLFFTEDKGSLLEGCIAKMETISFRNTRFWCPVGTQRNCSRPVSSPICMSPSYYLNGTLPPLICILDKGTSLLPVLRIISLFILHFSSTVSFQCIPSNYHRGELYNKSWC